MKAKLALNGVLKMISGMVCLGLLLFLPAGTWSYPGAWRLAAILFVPMMILGVSMLCFAPELLKKRLNTNEQEPEQKKVILMSSLVFVASFILCGLDFRFGWTKLPMWAVYLGCAVFLLCYLGYAELMRENAYLSRTVEVQEGQKVISTGMYGIVRHPMYSIIILMFFSMPIVLGSLVGIIPLLLVPYILVKRILNEEKVLTEGLSGYAEYKEKVKYRLLPFVW